MIGRNLRAEEEKLYLILEEGRKYVVDENFSAAIPYYEDYLSKAEPNVLILKEYGDVFFRAGEYQKALSTYNEVLAQGSTTTMLKCRVRNFIMLWMIQHTRFMNLTILSHRIHWITTQNYIWADTYAKAGITDSARIIYNDLLEDWQLDSTQTAQVTQRKSWLPVTGLVAVLETFPNYVGLAPSTQYYADNTSFRLSNFGARLELGLTSFITVGISFYKTYLSATESSLDSVLVTTYNFTGSQDLTTFKGLAIINIAKNLNMGRV